MRVALFAGEASGDQLGVALMQALKKKNPAIEFIGVGGDLMQAEGLDSRLPIADFAVMGITEIVKSLPRLLYYRRLLTHYFREQRPDVFIGIDYPEFNLSLEKRLKALGISTVHYVSPSVWAWREERIHGIKASCDLMLTLFAFEKQFYDAHDMNAVYCGHPLVDLIAPDSDPLSARRALGLLSDEDSATVMDTHQASAHDVTFSPSESALSPVSPLYLAVLPGSRHGEVAKMMGIYLAIMKRLAEQLPQIQFLIPAANQDLMTALKTQLQHEASALNTHVFLKQGHRVMQAADAVLLTSGTATLEAMLLNKPMVVAYQVSRLTAHLAKKRLKIAHFSLPNLLANETVVPEFIQDAIDTDAMARALYQQLTDDAHRAQIQQRLAALRNEIKTNAAENAAEAVYQQLLTVTAS